LKRDLAVCLYWLAVWPRRVKGAYPIAVTADDEAVAVVPDLVDPLRAVRDGAAAPARIACDGARLRRRRNGCGARPLAPGAAPALGLGGRPALPHAG
jgi:hypothetical protein